VSSLAALRPLTVSILYRLNFSEINYEKSGFQGFSELSVLFCSNFPFAHRLHAWHR
jgi:hypothetical protein